MREFDIGLIGEPATYPGHPLVLAYLISRAYPSLDAAHAVGHTFQAALEDIRIPGAGGAVYRALDYLDMMRNGRPLDELERMAREEWAGTCASDVRQDPTIGQRQADRLRERLDEMAAWTRAGAVGGV